MDSSVKIQIFFLRIGIEVETRHFRNGQEMPEVNRDPHYSAHFQEIRPLHNIIKVLPVSCNFRRR